MSISSDLVNGINNLLTNPNDFFQFSTESLLTILFFMIIILGIFGTWLSNIWIKKNKQKNEYEKRTNYIKKNYFIYIFVIVFLVLIVDTMWTISIEESERRSFPQESFAKASKWLSQNLEENETALIPTYDVFLSFEHSLFNKTSGYDDIWKSSEVIVRANITKAEKNFAREHLKEYIKNDENLKYVVIDWVDRHGSLFFENMNCKNFLPNLKEAKRFFFTLPTEQEGQFWRSGIMICEITKK